jgi:hypothetical protein
MKSRNVSELRKSYIILLGFIVDLALSTVISNKRQFLPFDHIIQLESSLGHVLQSQIEAWFFQDTFNVTRLIILFFGIGFSEAFKRYISNNLAF